MRLILALAHTELVHGRFVHMDAMFKKKRYEGF